MKWLMKILGKRSKNRTRFTLVELVMVVIIVDILTAAALPAYTSFIQKAYTSEAIASLGAIKTAENVYYAENGYYTTDWGKLGMTSDNFARNQWFSPGCFGLTGNGTHFTAWCNGDTGKEQVKGIYLKLTHDGEVEACTLADITEAKPIYVPQGRG